MSQEFHPPLLLKTTSKPTTEPQLPVLQHPHLHRRSCDPVKQTEPNTPVGLHRLTLRIIHQKDTQQLRLLGTTWVRLIEVFVAVVSRKITSNGVQQQRSSMQVITCALFTLVTLPISASWERDSCPAVCECSEWKTLTISCFDIDILPRFPASTETL